MDALSSKALSGPISREIAIRIRQEQGRYTQTFVSGYLVGGGLPREGVGPEKFSMSLKTQGNRHFGGISRDLGWDIPGVPEKFEGKTCIQLLAPTIASIPHITSYIYTEVSSPSKLMLRHPLLVLKSWFHTGISEPLAHSVTFRTRIMRYPIKTSPQEFRDSIATSMARYAKYCCRASKPKPVPQAGLLNISEVCSKVSIKSELFAMGPVQFS